MLDKIKDYFDEYSLKARVFPSLIALAPLFLFFYFILKENLNFGALKNLISSTTITVIGTYFISDVVRNLGKILEIKIFGNELYFPTTEILLHKNAHISHDRQSKIYDKIKADFGIALATPQEEINDEQRARQKIKEAIGSVRQKVGNGRLLLQYNIRYGFWRNLVGVSWISCILCIFIIIFMIILHNKNTIGLLVSIVLFMPYFLIFLFKRSILNFFGYQYAEQLLLEYLDKK